MKLSDIGEFGFIAREAAPFLASLPAGTVGIGDDCAVIPWAGDQSLLVTTDMLVEDVHFLRSRMPARDLGYKSLAVNLSDIAAMGGAPTSAFLSIAIPADLDVEWLDEFYAGLRELAQAEHVQLLGGDTTREPAHVVVNIAVLGRVATARARYRSAARPGDVICVTDRLGDSGGGLKALIEGRGSDPDIDFLVGRHFRPRPHLAEGAWLAAQEGVRAMMDVSDGIDSDLQRIMERSGCGASVDLDRVPLSDALRRTASRCGWNAAELGVSGGEDYCLLVTVEDGRAAAVASGFERAFGRPLFAVGTITAPGPGLVFRAGGRRVQPGQHGWDHFRC